MEAPRPAATRLHRKLKDWMYRFAEKHSLTGFEAAGVMFALATEVMASALVREGLLQGKPDWAEEAEDAPGDSETVQELIRDNKALGDGLDRLVVRCTQLSEANTEHVARIAMLENGLREMAELALHEIEQQKTQLDEELIIGMSDDELQARGLRKSLQLAGRKTQIDELLRHCGLTTSTTPTP
jgi:hypothetical protein